MTPPDALRRQLLAALAAVTAGAAGTMPSRAARAADTRPADAWPVRPVRLIVPFATGGTTDIVARLCAPGLGAAVHGNLVVDNRAGAGGTVGAQQLAAAAPDGYTIGMATASVLGTAPSVYKPADLKYDPRSSFTPIVKLVDVPGVISVHPSFPAHDFDGFVRELKAHPGRYGYATAGVGSIGHMAMELFNLRAGTRCVHVPYRGGGPALNDVLGGQVPIFWDNLSSSLPYLQQGKLIGIGLAFNRRIDELPKLATFAELGLKDYDTATWFGLSGPAGLPAPVVDALNRAANQVVTDKALIPRLIEAGAYPAGGTPADLQRTIDAELAKWAEVARFANIAL